MSDATNRTVLSLIALVLIGLGVVELLALAGLVPLQQPSALYDLLIASVQARPGIWWPALIAGAVVLAVLALVWALRQLVVRRTGGALSTLTLQSGDKGRTTVEPSAVASAAAADLGRLPAVTSSSARLVGEGRQRVLRTRLDVLAGADLDDVRSEAEEVYDRVATALGVGRLDTHTRLRPVGGDPPRVR